VALLASRIDKTPTGYDCIHSLTDDRSRLAYSEILADPNGVTCAVILKRAAKYIAALGINHIERGMRDNAWAYHYSLGEVVAKLGAKQVSSVHRVFGRTARSNASTARCRAIGCIEKCSPRMRSAQRLLRRGSCTTTIDGAAQPSISGLSLL
jgi:hypothetical protein